MQIGRMVVGELLPDPVADQHFMALVHSKAKRESPIAHQCSSRQHQPPGHWCVHYTPAYVYTSLTGEHTSLCVEEQQITDACCRIELYASNLLLYWRCSLNTESWKTQIIKLVAQKLLKIYFNAPLFILLSTIPYYMESFCIEMNMKNQGVMFNK